MSDSDIPNLSGLESNDFSGLDTLTPNQIQERNAKLVAAKDRFDQFMVIAEDQAAKNPDVDLVVIRVPEGADIGQSGHLVAQKIARSTGCMTAVVEPLEGGEARIRLAPPAPDKPIGHLLSHQELRSAIQDEEGGVVIGGHPQIVSMRTSSEGAEKALAILEIEAAQVRVAPLAERVHAKRHDSSIDRPSF